MWYVIGFSCQIQTVTYYVSILFYIWSEHTQEILLPVGHFQCVFNLFEISALVIFQSGCLSPLTFS